MAFTNGDKAFLQAQHDHLQDWAEDQFDDLEERSRARHDHLQDWAEDKFDDLGDTIRENGYVKNWEALFFFFSIAAFFVLFVVGDKYALKSSLANSMTHVAFFYLIAFSASVTVSAVLMLFVSWIVGRIERHGRG